MKIAIIGAAGTGKTSFVKQFLEQWPMYTMPQRTFRNIVVENNLPINLQGNLDAQTQIRNALVEQALEMSGNKHVLHDRCVLDNLAYTLYLSEQPDTTITPQFIKETIHLVQKTVKLYDLIFYFPFDASIVESLDNAPSIDVVRTARESDIVYRQSLDNILQTFVEYSVKRNGILFDPTDCPPIIPIIGSTEEKLIQTTLYVDQQGNPYETGALLKDDINQMSQIVRP